MRIGHYMHGLWLPGGVATYLERVSEALEGRGHTNVFFDSSVTADEPRALAVRSSAHLGERARAEGVDVLHLQLDIAGPSGALGDLPRVRTHQGHHAYCPSGTQFLSRPGEPCERVAGVAACTWGHLVDRCGSARPHLLVADFRRHRAERRSALTTPVVIANSEFVKARLIRDGHDASRIRVLPNPAAEVEPLPEPPGGSSVPRVAFLGRIVPQKGLLWLLEALAGTGDVAVHLDVCGTGPDEEPARAAAQRLGITDRVTFHGWLPPEEMTAILAGVRAVVVPSVWHEPAGLSAIESAALGRAVIASRTGGLPEAVHDGVTGLLVAPGDVGGLTAALARVATDAEAAARWGREGVVLARARFGLAAHVDDLLAAYAEARMQARHGPVS